MFTHFKLWLASPSFEEESITHHARLVNIVLMTALASYLLVLLGDYLGGRTPLAVKVFNIFYFTLNERV